MVGGRAGRPSPGPRRTSETEPKRALDTWLSGIILPRAGTFPQHHSEGGAGVHVGLAGAGRIGTLHAEILRESSLVDGLTVADADPERAARVAAVVGAACVATPQELPAAGIDALVLAAATPAHPHLIQPAGQAGLPCLSETPTGRDLPTT